MKCHNINHDAIFMEDIVASKVNCPVCEIGRLNAELAAAREEIARFGAKEIALKQLWNKAEDEADKLRALCAEADETMDGYVDRCNITRVRLRAAADGRPIPATDAHRSAEDIRQIMEG